MIQCLIIGDSHIPRRAKEVPEKIYKKLIELTTTNPFDYTFFTGDITEAPNFIEFLKQNTKEMFYAVIGNMDYYGGNREAPVYQELELAFFDNDKIVIGLTHGAQIHPRGDHSQLEVLAYKKRFTILITGHTHKEEVYLTEKGILLINPGSITGAWSFIASHIPTFSIIKVNRQTKEIFVNLFQLDKKNEEISITKSYLIFRNGRIQYAK